MMPAGRGPRRIVRATGGGTSDTTFSGFCMEIGSTLNDGRRVH